MSSESDRPSSDHLHMGAVQFFDLSMPYLSQGQVSEYRALGESLSVMMKIYSSGGENRMHKHPEEDHCFIVLEGEATFEIESSENKTVVEQHQGVLLPRGTSYRFMSSSERCLVMLRIGSPGKPPKRALYPDGSQKVSAMEPTASLTPVRAAGGFALSAKRSDPGGAV